MARTHVFFDAGDQIDSAVTKSGDSAWLSAPGVAIWFDRPEDAEAMARVCAEIAEKMRASRARWEPRVS